MKSARFAEALRLLRRHDVEFIVVGMAAAVLQGVPLTTLDIDIVHRRTPENVEALLAALSEIDAVYRDDERNLAPTQAHLLGPGHQLLTTKFGDLDCLGVVADDKAYDDLLPHTRALEVGEGVV